MPPASTRKRELQQSARWTVSNSLFLPRQVRIGMAAINLKSLVGKLNPTSPPCSGSRGRDVPVAHQLQCRNRALAHQAARAGRLRSDANSQALRCRHIARQSRADEIARFAENRQRPGAGDVARSRRPDARSLGHRIAQVQQSRGSLGPCFGHRCWRDRNLSGRVCDRVRPSLAKIPAEQLENDLPALTAGTAEEAELARSQPGGGAFGGARPRPAAMADRCRPIPKRLRSTNSPPI